MHAIYEKYLNMDPGKYWKLPENKKHLIDQYLVDKNYMPMVKYDGYWARIIIMEKEVIIQSRGISTVTKTYGEYQDRIPHIVEELKINFPAGTVLLGELCYPDFKKGATHVGSVLRSLPPKAIKLQEVEENRIHLRFFDVLVYGYEELISQPFEERFRPRYLVGSHNIYTRAAMTCHPHEAKEMLEWVWSQGGEGIILINNKLPYNIGGAKAWHSIKVKRELGDLEGKVVGTIEPTKIYDGDDRDNWNYWESNIEGLFTKERLFNMVKIEGDFYPVTKPHYFGRKVGVIVEYQGRKINVTSGTTEEDGEYLATDAAQNLIKEGKLYAVFTGMELTPESVRHPRLLRLRDDI